MKEKQGKTGLCARFGGGLHCWLVLAVAAIFAALGPLAHADEDPIETTIFEAATTKVGVIGALAGTLVAAVLAIAIVIKYAKKWGKG